MGKDINTHQYVISRVFNNFFQECQSALYTGEFAFQNLDVAMAYIRIVSCLPVNACLSLYVTSC